MPRIRPEEMPHPPSPGSLHDDHVIALLRSGAHAALLSAYFGEAEYRELSLLARLAATRRPRHEPTVWILPGIMGSKLGTIRDSMLDLLWLHPPAVAEGKLAQLALSDGEPARPLSAVGVMLPGYLKMKLTLEVAGFHAEFHAFDWRRDLLELGADLLADIERAGEKQIMLVCHSMGGLVARAALALDRDRRIGRLIQIAAPNEGSFAPVQALRAVYPTVRKLAALDPRHSAEELAQRVFRTLPGLYQLLPSAQASPGHDLFDLAAWPRDGLVPDERLLARAKHTRARLAAADERCRVIVGTGQETVTSVTLRDGQFEYTSTLRGDGTVPVHCAEWPGAPTWYAHGGHGELTNDDVVLAAVIDLLASGETARLSRRRPAENGAVRRVTDAELRRQVADEVRWESLSLDARRRILDPVITPEFAAPA